MIQNRNGMINIQTPNYTTLHPSIKFLKILYPFIYFYPPVFVICKRFEESPFTCGIVSVKKFHDIETLDISVHLKWLDVLRK